MCERISRVGGTLSIGPNEENGDGVTVHAWVPG
jgi:hypothetical protein